MYARSKRSTAQRDGHGKRESMEDPKHTIAAREYRAGAVNGEDRDLTVTSGCLV